MCRIVFLYIHTYICAIFIENFISFFPVHYARLFPLGKIFSIIFPVGRIIVLHLSLLEESITLTRISIVHERNNDTKINVTRKKIDIDIASLGTVLIFYSMQAIKLGRKLQWIKQFSFWS